MEKEKTPQPQPVTLLVDPTRTGNTISLFIRVLDQDHNNIPNIKLTIRDNGQLNLIRVSADENGEYYHQFILFTP